MEPMNMSIGSVESRVGGAANPNPENSAYP